MYFAAESGERVLLDLSGEVMSLLSAMRANMSSVVGACL